MDNIEGQIAFATATTDADADADDDVAYQALHLLLINRTHGCWSHRCCATSSFRPEVGGWLYKGKLMTRSRQLR